MASFLHWTFPACRMSRKQLLMPLYPKERCLMQLMGYNPGKSPGSDGLCAEFYKEFQNILVNPLLDTFNDSLFRASLLQSLREANNSLMFKKDKAPEDCASYRPIKLLNVNVNILSKLLATGDWKSYCPS